MAVTPSSPKAPALQPPLTPETSPTREPSPTREMAAELHRWIERGRARWRVLIRAEAISLAVALPLAYLWLVFLLDNLIHLPPWGLLLANVGFLVAVAWMVRRLVRKWRTARFTADEVALAMEQRTPGGVENRLINALQLSRVAAADQAAMADVVIGENYHALRQVRLQPSAESGPVLLRAGIALLLVAVGVGFWGFSAKRFTTSAARLFLPLAGIDPVYRTHLAVQPGNVTVQAGAPVTIKVKIDGQVPDSVQLMVNDTDHPTAHRLPVDRQNATASYTLPAVRASTTYWLSGGDYRTPQFQITVPVALQLRTLAARATCPAYTRQGEQSLESRTGDLEALAGTQAQLTFTLNQPVEAAWLVISSKPQASQADQAGPPSPVPSSHRVELKRISPDHYTAQYTFTGDDTYLLHAHAAAGQELQTAPARLHATADLPPQVRLTGVESGREVMLEDVLKLSVRGEDDYGLKQVGLFWRPLPEPAASAAATQPAAWQPIRTWDVSKDPRPQQFHADASLLLDTLGIAEGDRLELAARAQDEDPAKSGQWTTGALYTLTASSPGAALQLIYERILRGEHGIDDLIAHHTDLDRQIARWMRDLEPDSSLNWQDKATLQAFAKAMTQIADTQAKVRLSAGAIARQMPHEAPSSFPQTLAMLADTEMERAIRILNRVSPEPTPQARRATLAEARLTVQRTLRALKDLQDRYITFREDWELDHMTSFTQMLAQRQQRLAEASGKYAGLPTQSVGDAQRSSMSRRQGVVLELSRLAQRAFEGMARRDQEVGKILTDAFQKAAHDYEASGLQTDMTHAADQLGKGAWPQAQPLQKSAADKLAAIYDHLKAAQTEMARKALADLQELAKSNLDAQKELEKLRAGKKDLLAMEENLSIKDTVRVVKLTEKIRDKKDAQSTDERQWARTNFQNELARLQTVARNTVDTRTHTLSSQFIPEVPKKGDGSPGEEGNIAQSVVQQQLEDVIGDLVGEAEDIVKDYASNEAIASWAVADTHSDVGRITPDAISSAGATSSTGNQPPPAEDIGGAARTGRLGARSHGKVVGDDFVDRFGRAAQEGQEDIAPQGGKPMKERASANPQNDEATGTGGKTVDSRQTHFSTKDAGKWKDSTADNMEKPQAVVQIVERQGDPISAAVADRMRDFNNRQEQLIQRIKAIKKELNKRFLPTDRLDKLLAQMQNNLDRLRSAPDAEVFRQQMQLISKLQSSVIVFQSPGSQFEQSLPRRQQVKGQILDEKSSPSFPGYQDAVESYYRRLSNLEDAH